MYLSLFSTSLSQCVYRSSGHVSLCLSSHIPSQCVQVFLFLSIFYLLSYIQPPPLSKNCRCLSMHESFIPRLSSICNHTYNPPTPAPLLALSLSLCMITGLSLRLTSLTKFLASFRRTSGAILGTRSLYSPINHKMLARAMGTAILSTMRAMWQMIPLCSLGCNTIIWHEEGHQTSAVNDYTIIWHEEDHQT